MDRRSRSPGWFAMTTGVIALVVVLLDTSAAAEASSERATMALGAWTPPKMDAVIEIAPCGDELCATLTKHAYAGLADHDALNPDPALRRRPLVGATILEGLTRKSGTKWRGGALYDPRTGKSYMAKIELLDQERLKIVACVGPGLCKGYVWTRYREVDPLKPSQELIAMAAAGGLDAYND
ncbi:MAG: DUF2147 domain-containing protein [Pseudomonadota bacterium]